MTARGGLLILAGVAALGVCGTALAQQPRGVIPWLQGEEQAAPAPITPEAQTPDPNAPQVGAPQIGSPQPGAPQIGAPRTEGDPLGAAAQDPQTGAQAGETIQLPSFGAPGKNTPAAVETAAVGAVGVGAAGTLSPEAAGLPKDAWRGADAQEAADQLGRLTPSDLHAANRLAVRLLSAALTPPSDGAAVFDARVAALSRFGAAEAAAVIGETAGLEAAAKQPAWRAAALASGRDGALCQAVVDDQAEAGDLETIYCRGLMGDAASALLSIQTLRTIGGVDPALLDLLEAVADPSYASFVEAPDDPSALSVVELASLRAASLPLPTGFAETAPLSMVGAALTEQAAPRERLSALERLEAAGTVETDALRAAFESAASAESGGVWGRVEVYRKTVAAAGGARVARAVEALRRADAEGREAQMARLLAPALAEAAVSGDAAARRLLRLGGRLAAASRLMDAAVAPEERGLDRIAYPEGRTAWSAPDAAPAAAKAARGDQASGRLLAALIAFGHPVPDPLLYPVPEQLSFMVAEGRVAEIAFSALARLRPGSAVAPDQLHAALRELIAIGLDEEARRIALEAVLLGG